MPELRQYDPIRRAEILEDLWKVTKNDNTLRVELRTHPMGWEVCALVASQMHRTQVCKTEADVRSTSEAWLTEATTRGWVA